MRETTCGGSGMVEGAREGENYVRGGCGKVEGAREGMKSNGMVEEKGR